MSHTERFSYNDPPHWANAAITDWHVYDDGERISVSQLVEKANQQEQHIKDLLAEIQEFKPDSELSPEFLKIRQILAPSCN